MRPGRYRRGERRFVQWEASNCTGKARRIYQTAAPVSSEACCDVICMSSSAIGVYRLLKTPDTIRLDADVSRDTEISLYLAGVEKHRI